MGVLMSRCFYMMVTSNVLKGVCVYVLDSVANSLSSSL